MAFASDPQFLVLHGLRLKGFSEAEPLAHMVGLDPAEAEKLLDRARSDELVMRRDGRMSGWALTHAGRSEHHRMITEETDEAGARDQVQRAYERFLEINHDLLAICTDWQMRTEGVDQVLNDHTDLRYDAGVIKRLHSVDKAVQPICDEVGSSLERFSRYGPRLSAALAKIRAGETEWFTKPLIDSYHTVWFEMHEDLLVTLAIERTKEGQS